MAGRADRAGTPAVALKLIRAGMYDDAILHRFQAERQSLAIMDHPAIAKVFDAGTTEAGQPYFVMEYVPGLPITEYCDQKKLKIRDRLELFIAVCEGVQHAHQKAIIHRDLKPANILVVEVDGKPMPRIIDFGLAKAVTPQGRAKRFSRKRAVSRHPRVHEPGASRARRAGYRHANRRLLARRDSLRTADWLRSVRHDRSGRSSRCDEVLRQLREEDAPTAEHQSAAMRPRSAAAGSRDEPKQLVSQLRGDLDWITMKAIEKDQDRRYGTPSELAADLRRYLDHEPVMARPASAAYRLKKYVRRHRLAVARSGRRAALLLVGFAGDASRAIAADHARTRPRDRDHAIS